MHRRTLFLSPDGDPTPPAPKPRVLPADRYIARYGSAEAAVSVLLQELDAAERTATGHADALDKLQKQLPGADKVVLPKAEADELAKYRALNLAPEKITEALTERDTLKGTVSTISAKQQARAAAVAGGVDPDAFEDYALRTKLPIELRDMAVVEHGKTVTKKATFVRNPADDKAAFVPLSDYVGTLPAHEQRALKPSAQSTPTGIEYPAQRPTSPTGSPMHPADDYLSRRFPAKQPTAAAAS